MRKNYITLFIQQNVARRHTPTAALNQLLDELSFFTYIRRNNCDLEAKMKKSAFPEVLIYLQQFANTNGKLPRVIPICFIQEPVLIEGKPSGFDGKVYLFAGENPRACIVTLKNIDVSLLEGLSNRDNTCALLCSRDVRLGIVSFYSDIAVNEVRVPIEGLRNICPTVFASGDSNAHSVVWGNLRGNQRGHLWEEFLAEKQLDTLNNSNSPSFSNHLGSSCIDISITNDNRKFSNWQNTSLFNDSDHSILLCTTAFNNAFVERKYQNIDKANWEIFKSSLEPLPKGMITSTANLNDRASNFTYNIIQAFNKGMSP